MTHKECLAEIEKQIEGLSCYHYNAHQKSISYLLTRVRVLTEALENLHIVDLDPDNEFAVVRYDAWIAAIEALDEESNIIPNLK